MLYNISVSRQLIDYEDDACLRAPAKSYLPASSNSLNTSIATLSALIAAAKPPYSDICQIASAIPVLERLAFKPPSM